MTEEHSQPNQPNRPDEANAATQQGEARSEAPEGATPAADLFDLMGDEGEQFKKKEKKPESEPQAEKKAAGKAAGGAEKKKHPAGMEIHHAGHKLALPNEMTEAEVFAFLSDDFPEVTADRAEIREDRQKNRLVVAFKSFKKGRR